LVLSIPVVIPAHNEAGVIGRCLEALRTGVDPPELEIVVVCNGCDDDTADRARAADGRIQVIETPVASKAHALNAGDTTVTGFPRFYIDADVVISGEAIRLIASRLEGDVLAASPTMAVDLSRSSWPVRAYYRIWTRLPYVREGMMGVGVYALSEEGRRRFDAFPDVISDDGYVRMLFGPTERSRVDGAKVQVTAPRRFDDLIRIKTRSRLGLYQLHSRYGEIASREQRSKSYRGAAGTVAFRPWLWPHACVYLAVQLATRRRARSQLATVDSYVWKRDVSSRLHDVTR
jgi:glycosyltransferase involved in cell wall biosynthesis